MNNSRVVFKPGWLLPLAVISIVFMALAFGAATSNKADAQSGGPGNGGEGGGSHDHGAWEFCIADSGLDFDGAITVALAKLNAREAGGHQYTLIQMIACGVKSKGDRCEDSDDILFAFRFILNDLSGGPATHIEKNVKVCHH